MKRRFLALMLVLLMLCPVVFAGCTGAGSSDTEESDAAGKTTVRDTVSLTMWVVTDEKTTVEAQDAVEKAFNVITKSTYTTAVDLIFYTKDEYEAALNAKFAEIDDRVANGSPKKPETTETGEQYFVNELGVNELKYPDIYENQVDIIYIAGRDQLNSLVNAGRLMKLNDSLSATGAAKVLNDVIPQQLFAHTKMGLSGKDSYAVPNNRIVGNYKYLLVNKELVTGDANGDGTVSGDEVNGTYLNFSDIDDFFDCEAVIEYAKANKPDMIPILNKFENPYVQYWSKDGSFSVLASRVDPSLSYEDVAYDKRLSLANVFGMSYFVDFELLMKKYEVENYFAGDVDAALQAQNFGVAVIEGDTTVSKIYGDKYYIKTISTPELNDDNLYTSFYGISSCTINFNRALEIIVMLNTNSELRNTLQYGVEGVHYELDDDGRVVRLNQSYLMDIATTGNVFIAYPEEYMPDDVWEKGVAANLNIQVDPMTGFWKVESKIRDEIFDNLSSLSKSYKEEMEACETVEELKVFFAAKRTEVNRSQAYKNANAKVAGSISTVYSEWFNSNWPSPAGN